MASGREKAKFEGHAGGIRSLVLSPDGRALASTGQDYNRGGVSIKVWELATLKERVAYYFPYKQMSVIHCLAFGHTSRILVSGSNNGVVKAWDLGTGTDTTLLDDENIAVYSLKFSPDGKSLAAARSDGAVVFWDVIPGTPGAQN